MSAPGLPRSAAVNPPTVVFDVGGVLIDWDPRHLYRKLFADRQEMERFLAEVCSPEWNHSTDLGRPFADAVAGAQRAHPEYAELIAAYWTRWDEMLARPWVGSVAVLAELQEQGVACYALTNFSHETWPRACRRYPWLHRFAGLVVSGREGVAKPDPAIYRRLLARYRLDPENVVFVDDKPANVAAAQRLGMRGHPFTSALRLRAALRDEGLPLSMPHHHVLPQDTRPR